MRQPPAARARAGAKHTSRQKTTAREGHTRTGGTTTTNDSNSEGVHEQDNPKEEDPDDNAQELRRADEGQRVLPNFHMWTLNMRKKCYSYSEDSAEARDRSCRWIVTALQEMGTIKNNERAVEPRAGHKMFIAGSTRGVQSTAMLTHRDWAQRVHEVRHGHRWTSVRLQARQGPTQSNVGMQLLSIHMPSEVNHTPDEIDIVMGDVVAKTKGKRAITLWGGDFSSTLQEPSSGAMVGSIGRRRGRGTGACPATMSSEIINEHAMGEEDALCEQLQELVE